MLNEEQANKTELLHKIQFAVETVDVSKFYEAIILYSMEYKCEVPTDATKLVEAQERKASQDELKQVMQEIAIPVINKIKTNGEWNKHFLFNRYIVENKEVNDNMVIHFFYFY